MKYIKICLINLVLLIICNTISCSKSDKLSSPNIILIMSDDHAKRAVSCYNDELIETPNIDRIAREGICFENAFVTNAICAPSRAVILTGKYSHMNGLRDNRDIFNPNQVTFPQLLQNTGYYTALVGKWHLKSIPHGFDYWKVLPGQGSYYNPRFIELGDTLDYTGYVTDLITDFALEAIKKREKDKPFCLLLYHKAPHRNWMPNIKHLDLFKDAEFPLPNSYFDDYSTRSAAAREQDMEIIKLFNSFDLKLEPSDENEDNTGGKKGFNAASAWERTYERLTAEQKEAWNIHYSPIIANFRQAKLSGAELAKWKYQRYIKDYLRCVISIDENIGRILDYLDKSGLTQNTIVLYTSDQGFFLGEHGWYDKRFIYEESAGMPLLIRYPGKIPAGTVSNSLVLNLDFAPTFLDIAGVNIPQEMQGRSLRPLFAGKEPDDWRNSIYYHYYEYPHGWHNVKRHYGIRTDRYKLIHFYNDIDAWELYDLEKDPHEMNNIYTNSAYVKIVEKLKQELADLKEQYQDNF